MKIYSRKYFILGVIELGFFLFDLWLAWTERNAPVRTAWYDSIKWGLLAVMSFRIAFSRKYAAEALIAEHDEMRKLQEYKAERTAFWVCIWALIWLSCIIEESIIKSQRAFVNYGMGLCKYTGSRGKSGASDASAEVVARVRRVLDNANVVWQMAELGKVDAGGGGTVAAYMAQRDIDTLDAGVPVLSMHAPFETVGKLDCYMTFKGMKAIFETA